MARMKRLIAILTETVSHSWPSARPRMAAALAFYTTFSLAPLLIFAVAFTGLVFGKDAAEGKIVEQLEGVVGPSGAITIQQLIENASRPASGTLAAALGVITLLFGVTGVVGELQDSLNTIWNVKVKESASVAAIVKHRLISFAMVLGIGFLLLVSLILSAVLTSATNYAGQWMEIPDPFLTLADLVLSFIVIHILFAFLYKSIPDVQIGWRDVWWGAATASLLFAIGKFGLGYYFAHSTFASTYGAAGSLVVLLLWVYYSAQILFFGAELAQVTAASRHRIVPSPEARKTHRPEKRPHLRLRPDPAGRK
jgi:membrane protein